MRKTIQEHLYNRVLTLYRKMTVRLNKHFALGRFKEFSKAQQHKLVQRIERLKAQLCHFERKMNYGTITAGTVAVFSLASLNSYAQFGPVGTEFRVNSSTSNDQSYPAIAMDSDGDFVVTWQSYNTEEKTWIISAQRYNTSGQTQGAEFKVNTSSQQAKDPSIAMDADGDFIIVWENEVVLSENITAYNIYAQRYTKDGGVQGSEFVINSASNSQYKPAVAMDSDGDFVVTYEENKNIFARRYNASGVAQGSQFMVNGNSNADNYIPAIAMDADGNFVITWENITKGNYNVHARKYSTSGEAAGESFLVNTHTTESQRRSAIAMDSDGDFVIAWQSRGQSDQNNEIIAQRFNSSVQKLGGEFIVNTYTTRWQEIASVAMDNDGDFVVSWSGEAGGGDTYSGIYAQRYNKSGIAQGNEFLVNTFTDTYQYRSSVAMDSDGDFTIVWQSTQDGNGYGIYGQRYANKTATSVASSMVFSSYVTLYPNPARDRVQVNLEGDVLIRVLDLSGSIVREELAEKSFSIAGLLPGMYMVEFTQDGQTGMKKLIVE